MKVIEWSVKVMMEWCENDGIVCECERGWGVKVGEDDGMVFGGGEGHGV